MPTDYRTLHNQYSQGMSQPSTVRPNSQPGFNFLQGWSASPSAGYMPPKQPTQAPIQYGTPTQGGWIGGPDGQPIGGNAGPSWMNNGQDPRAMLHDGIKGNFASWRDSGASGAGDPRGMLSDKTGGNFLEWQNAYRPQQPGMMQANYGMQQPQFQSPQYDPYGKPAPMDQMNPGRNHRLPPGGI